MTDREKMQLTIELASLALDNGEIPIAAIIFLEDEIISKSYTTEKTDKRYLVHAELKALEEADIKRYSVKERKRMKLFTNLEPCMMCLGAAMSFYIGEIYYSIESPTDGAVGFARNCWKEESKDFPGYRLPPIYGGLMRNESKQLFIEYLKRNCENLGITNSTAALFVKSIANS